MEISDFASKVEKAYKDGKNKSNFNEAVNYMKSVVKKEEQKEKEALKEKVKAQDNYEK